MSTTEVQATVRRFDPDTGGGEVVLDDQRLLTFDAEALHGSRLRELRMGQRVRVSLDPADAEQDAADDDQPAPRVRAVRLISIT